MGEEPVMTQPLDEKIADLLKQTDALLDTLNAQLAKDRDDRAQIALQSTHENLKQTRKRFESAASNHQEQEKEDENGLSSGYHDAIDALVAAIKDTVRLFS
jgi:hypothetical protein